MTLMMALQTRIDSLPGVRRARRAIGLTRRGPKPLKPSDYPRSILSLTEGSNAIRTLLRHEQPALVARAGTSELGCCMFYLDHRRRGVRSPYPVTIRRQMGNNAGFFPISDDALDAFANEYLRAIALADALGVWFNAGENLLAEEICPAAQLIPLMSIEPYYHANPWSRALRGGRVLVVHPFAESIKEQYEDRRASLFDNPDVLPPFELHVLKAVQSIAGEPSKFPSWFAALQSMKEGMDAIDYEVCIVGAGAYGLPLAAHAKKSGKRAVHLGGATQVLFGIKGRRWDENTVSRLYNEHWVRPKTSEIPQNWTAVEDGCYW